VVVDGIKEECEKHGLAVPSMAVEPGRSIVANAGVTLYTVGSSRRSRESARTSQWTAHVGQHPHVALRRALRAFIANKADRPREMVATVAGKHCESGDIVVNDAPLQHPEVGDVLCVCATGRTASR